MEQLYGTGVAADEFAGLDQAQIESEFLDDALDVYAERERYLDPQETGVMRDLERWVLLNVVDLRWREHLENMDYMREGIHLRGMAQKDPLVEYRNEGHVMFQELNRAIREEVILYLYHLEPIDPAELEQQQQQNGRGNGHVSYEHQSLAGADAIAAAGGTATAAVAGGGSVATKPVVKSADQNIGRNDPCWCGSGKKYKRCHGA
jgi:preprotein translocase subunit SecA